MGKEKKSKKSKKDKSEKDETQTNKTKESKKKKGISHYLIDYHLFCSKFVSIISPKLL